MALAAVQIVVHMIYFLHMNTKSEGGWTFLALVFTLTLVVITLVGSIWVMYHMDQNMMLNLYLPSVNIPQDEDAECNPHVIFGSANFYGYLCGKRDTVRERQPGPNRAAPISFSRPARR